MHRPLRLAAALSFVLVAAPALAATPGKRPLAPATTAKLSDPLLEDVVRMTRAGIPEPAIVAFVRARRARLESVTADDLIALEREKVGEHVLSYLAEIRTDEPEAGSAEARSEESAEDEGTAYPVAPPDGGIYGYPYGYSYPYGWGFYPYGSFGFFIGRPFFGHRFFFRGRVVGPRVHGRRF